ncbi:hypothetical protein R1flu_014491 [Riccia fluitans]|uniref:Uncharacterized protein n=1 Tax=Riccia fluitans TaxID=41844 RepID=A0ABD1YGL5_9MARC
MGLELDSPWTYDEFLDRLISMQGEYNDLGERMAIHRRRIKELEAEQPIVELLARVTHLTEPTFLWKKKVNQLQESLKKWKSKSKQVGREHWRVRWDHEVEILHLKLESAAKDEELHHAKDKESLCQTALVD